MKCKVCETDKAVHHFATYIRHGVKIRNRMCKVCVRERKRRKRFAQGKWTEHHKVPVYTDGSSYWDVKARLFTPKETERQKRMSRGAW